MKRQFIEAVEKLILLAGFQPEPNEHVITIGDAIVFKLGGAFLAFTDANEEFIKYATPEFLHYVAKLPPQTVLVLGDVSKSAEVQNAMNAYFHQTQRESERAAISKMFVDAMQADEECTGVVAPEPVNPNAHPCADVIKTWADDTSLAVQWRRPGTEEWTSLTEGAKPTFNSSFEWRIVPPANEEICIPWDIVSPEYKFAAMDENGKWHFYTEKPRISDGTQDDGGYWELSNLNSDYAASVLKIDKVSDFRLSLQERK